MLESQFQARVISACKELFPGCIVLKNDANYLQGFPDLLILFEDRWAALEVKAYDGASIRPNQEYYVNILNEMSFAAFINPKNMGDVLYGLQQAFGLAG